MTHEHTKTLALVLAVGGMACSADAPGPPPEHTREAHAPIIGGMEDNAHNYVVGVGDASGSWCTGTLISRQTVITAAHCALGVTRVYYGKFLQTTEPADMEVVHPEWNGEVYTADVALVRLTSPTDRQAAPLLRATLDNTSTYIGPNFTFVGFGVTDGVNGGGAGIKREVMLPITAIGPTTTIDGIPVSDRFLYYENDAKNTCFGDSGGPTFYVDPQGVEHHTAVTSWGDQTCTIYGVQARNDQPGIDLWIQDTIDLFEGPDPCSNDGVCDEMCNTDEVLDPDCHVNHCGMDGVCAEACVAPHDPDCPEIFDPCGEDGICNEGCAPPDPDCPPPMTTTTGPAVVSVVVSSTTTSSSGAGGAGGDGPQRADPTERRGDLLYGRGCVCGVPGSDERPSHRPFWALLAGAALAWSRRRRS